MDVTTYLFACDRELCRSVSKNGRTPLHTASLHGQLRVLEFLLDECGLRLACSSLTKRCLKLLALLIEYLVLVSTQLQAGVFPRYANITGTL